MEDLNVDIFYVNEEQLSDYIESPDILEKMIDTVTLFNFFYNNKLTNLEREDINFTVKVENILNDELMTSSEKRTELLDLFTEDISEFLISMGIIINTDNVRTITPVYLILNSIYKFITQANISEDLPLDNDDDYVDYILSYGSFTDIYVSDLYNIFLGVEDIFLERIKTYNSEEISNDYVFDIVSNKISTLVAIEPNFANTRIVKEILINDNFDMTNNSIFTNILNHIDTNKEDPNIASYAGLELFAYYIITTMTDITIESIDEFFNKLYNNTLSNILPTSVIDKIQNSYVDVFKNKLKDLIK